MKGQVGLDIALRNLAPTPRERNHRLKKIFVGTLSFISMLAAPFCINVTDTSTVFAADSVSSVSMYPTVGFNGYFGKEAWVPISVRLHNVGPSNSASLVIRTHSGLQVTNEQMVMGTMHWTVHLPRNGWITEEIYVPSSIVDGQHQLYCEEDGDVVSSVYLNGNAVSNALVSVLSPETQASQFLTGSTAAGTPVLAVSVNPTQFPTDSNLLNTLTAVAASPEELEQLDATQRSSLLTWVQLGGLLIVTGTQGTTKTWQSVFPLFPGITRDVQTVGLAKFAGNNIPAPGKIMASTSQIQGGSTLWADANGIPLLAARTVGRGMICQTSFAPSATTLLGWTGNPLFWSNVLQEGAAPHKALTKLLDPHGALSLAAASNALSPLRVPSLKFWFIVFLGYLLVVGPLIFWLLRRIHRATLAWAILPIFSVLTTAGIYVTGVTTRPPGVLNEGVGVLELVGGNTGLAESYGVQAFMSPYRGGMSFQTTQKMLALPFAEPRLISDGSADVWNTEKASVSFNNVSRWSVGYLYTAGSVQKQGELAATLSSTFGILLGTVTNQTPYHLDDLVMFWDGRMYKIGDLNSGQSVAIHEVTSDDVTDDNWVSAYGAYNHLMTRAIGRPLETYAAESLSSLSPDDTEDAMFVATTSDATPSLPALLTEGKVAPNQSIVLVRQFVTIGEPSNIFSGGEF